MLAGDPHFPSASFPSASAAAPGSCPLCEGTGPVGTPCDQPICLKKGYHFIPAEQAARSQTRRGADPLVGRRINNWLVISVLGSGAFGTVYLVHQQDGAQGGVNPEGAAKVEGALKLLSRREDDPERISAMLKKFQLECEALAALDHPNIVGLIQVDRADDAPFLVMEYIAGGLTLKRLIDQARSEARPVPADVSWHVLKQVLSALGSAHAPPRRIVHRDIKPENIILQARDGDPYHVKVLDFGLAKFVEDGTETTQAMGTPAYMAPEQLWKQRIGPWTDLYAVGILVFELLCGKRPFAGTAEEIVQNKANPQFDVLTEGADQGWDSDTQAFLRRALAFDPTQRFGDADEMSRALDLLEPFLGFAAAYGDAMEMDPERLRLKRMEEAMEAERRRLDDDKRRLEQDRAQLDSQRLATGGLPPQQQPQMPQMPQPGVALPAAGQPQFPPQHLQQPHQPTPSGPPASGSKGGLFLGLAGGVLLVGVLLVVGKAFLEAKAEENVGMDAAIVGAVDAGATPAPAAAAPDAVQAALAPDATAAPEVQEAPEVLAAAPELAQPDPDAVAAAPEVAATPDATAEPDAVAATAPAAPDAASGGDAAAAAAAASDGAAAKTALTARGEAKAAADNPEAKKESEIREVKKLTRPQARPVVRPKPQPEVVKKAEPVRPVEAAKKPDSSGLRVDQGTLGEQFRKQQEEKKRLDALSKEFKKSQGRAP